MKKSVARTMLELSTKIKRDELAAELRKVRALIREVLEAAADEPADLPRRV